MNASLPPAARRFITIACVLASADLLVQNRQQLVGTFSLEPLAQSTFKPLGGATTLEVDAASNPYTPGSPMLHAVMSGQSFFNCYESLQTRRVATADGPLIAATVGRESSSRASRPTASSSP